MTRITITRQQLYDQVWSQPTLHVAREYGLSDVGLAKLCKRNSIPKPPRGYWARKEAGQSVGQTPLPDVEEADVEIVIFAPEEGRLENSGLRKEVDRLTDEESSAETTIEVAKNLRGAHALVSAANQELSGAKKDSIGFLRLPSDPTLSIEVSKDQLHRALRIMDAILKALNDRGFEVSRGPEVTIFDESVSFGIRESIKTIKEEPEDRNLDGDYHFWHSRTETKRLPSERLCLFLPDAEEYWASGCRKQWQDGKKQRLENLLNKFVAGLIEVAARKHEHTLTQIREKKEEAEAAQRRREQAKKREELIKLQQQEQARLDELLDLVQKWRTSQEIRSFVEMIREANHARGAEISPESELGQWLDWALTHADRFDPVKESSPSVLDEEIPEEPRRW